MVNTVVAAPVAVFAWVIAPVKSVTSAVVSLTTAVASDENELAVN